MTQYDLKLDSSPPTKKSKKTRKVKKNIIPANPIETKEAFVPSHYQAAIFEFAKNGQGNCLIEACAGGSKTTVLVELSKLIPQNESSIFLAFNKHIADHLSTRIPPTVQAKTFHGLCYGALANYYGGQLKVDKQKNYKILKSILKDDGFKLYEQGASKLSSLAKNHGVGILLPDTEKTWFNLIEHHGIGEKEYPGLTEKDYIELSRILFKKSLEAHEESIDFDDMIYLCLLYPVEFKQYKWILVDESQDVSSCQIEIIKKIVSANSRIWFSGDKNQSIYGFRGADVNSMDNLSKHFNCTELPLSISYRCPKSVVRLAQKLVPSIEYRDNAPEGIVDWVRNFDARIFRPDDMILCRNTKPLVQLAYNLISDNVGCHILGKDIGNSLIKIIEKVKVETTKELIPKLQKSFDRLVDKNIKNNVKSSLAEDNLACAIFLAKRLDGKPVKDLASMIYKLFDDSRTGILTLSTVHKAKGLEFDRVFILDKKRYMPSKQAVLPHQIQQEKNIEYVAITRAKKELYFISSAGYTTGFREDDDVFDDVEDLHK